MSGAEPAEVGGPAEIRGRAPQHAGDALEGGAAPLPAGAAVAVDLVAGPKLVLADEALADVDVTAVGKVAGLAAPQEAVATDQLEDAGHQVAAATERLIRNRIAVSPCV